MILLSAGISIYTLSYLILSCNGNYIPEAYGLNNVKWYVWAPKWFVSKDKWNIKLMIFYYPLLTIDNFFWHKTLYRMDSKYSEVNKKFLLDSGSKARDD
jgi:hypothetical protein